MKIFVTGGTGYIGNAVVKALVRAGLQVMGLARSAEKGRVLQSLGAEAVHGDLKSPSNYAQSAAKCDAVIHMGFERGAEGAGIDRIAVEGLLSCLRKEKGTRKSFIYTSGVLVLGNTGDAPADENAPTRAPDALAWRPGVEKLVLDSASDNIATAVIRPGFVWGGGNGNFGLWFSESVKHGAPSVIGNGQNRRAYIHREDLAELYRLVVEKRANGVFHGVDGAWVVIEQAARLAGELAGGRGQVRRIPLEEARKSLGPFADALCSDQLVISKRSPELGWKPSRPIFPNSVPAAYAEWRRENASK